MNEENSSSKNILGKYLRTLREQHGISRTALAEQLGKSLSTISSIERNTLMVSKEMLKLYADFFKVDFSFLEDLRQNQKLLTLKDQPELKSVNTLNMGENIFEELVHQLKKLDFPLQKKLIESFKNQANEEVFKATVHYTLTDLRDIFLKEISFESNSTNFPFSIEGFLKLPEDNQLFFRINRSNKVLFLELLQGNRNKIDMFEKWMGPYDFSSMIKVKVPQIIEEQNGVHFTWYSPNTTLKDQYNYILESGLNINSILPNTPKLLWFIQQNYKNVEDEM